MEENCKKLREKTAKTIAENCKERKAHKIVENYDTENCRSVKILWKNHAKL